MHLFSFENPIFMVFGGTSLALERNFPCNYTEKDMKNPKFNMKFPHITQVDRLLTGGVHIII